MRPPPGTTTTAAERPPRTCETLSQRGREFATGDYALALAGARSELEPAQARSIAEAAQYTGLPVAYIDKANLRINGGEFEKNLQDANGLTTGRLDTRFSGPTWTR